MATIHSWKFFRTGGLDQVALETADDLLHLEQLDQKLWVALSCPVKGLELDERTLALIDADHDGRIRAPELIAAVKWAAARLKNPADLLKGEAALPLAAINDATPEGRALVASARQVLGNLGRKDAATISVAESSDTAKIFASNSLNGDGVIPPEATEDPAVQALIRDIVATVGGVNDRTGSSGVTAEKIAQFFSELQAYADWVGSSATKEIAILGEGTDAAVAALRAVRAKVDDYFGRCRLAAFDSRALGALNRAETDYLDLTAKDMKITADEVAGFPLARISAGCPLPLVEGVNPAWAAALATLRRTAVAPLWGADKQTLSEAEWSELNAKFAAYETWLGGKPGSAVEKLGLTRVKEILGGNARAALDELVRRDRELEPHYQAISDVDRLARYYRDLRTLLKNFISFEDFYSPERLATFQAGVLFLDSRSTELCVRVDAASPLAAMSKAYIAYCDLKRAGGHTMKIAACFTQGDSDYLFVGRNGLFYDRQGRDWDATITSIVENPISVGQAFWSPYKKFIRMIEEQVAKRAAAAEAASTGKLAAAAEQTAHADKAAPAPAGAAPKKIDVGTVAALGVAAGAIMGALGAIATGLAKLAPWQLPLVVVGLMLIISLPSVAIAWLKLRQRTIGPLLESTGWAINGRVKINIPFGSKLTEVAHLPPGARRSLADPYLDREAVRRRRLFWLALVVLAAIAVRVHHTYFNDGRYFWQKPPASESAEPAVVDPAK
jgi:hypothetical protein